MMDINISYDTQCKDYTAFYSLFKSMPIGAVIACGYIGHIPSLAAEKTPNKELIINVGRFFSQVVSPRAFWNLYTNKPTKENIRLLAKIQAVLDGKGLGATTIDEIHGYTIPI